MRKEIENWVEKHCTDSDHLVGNAHKIVHSIYIEDGKMIHERITYKYDEYNQEFYAEEFEGTILIKGLK